MSSTLRKDTVVVVIGLDHYLVGQQFIIVKKKSFPTEPGYIVRVCGEATQIYLPANILLPVAALFPELAAKVEEARAARAAKVAADWAAWEGRRQAERTEARIKAEVEAEVWAKAIPRLTKCYVSKGRHGNPDSCQITAEISVTGPDYERQGRLWQQVNRVDASRETAYGDIEKSTVNWAALGSTTVEEALAYSRAIAFAAEWIRDVTQPEVEAWQREFEEQAQQAALARVPEDWAAALLEDIEWEERRLRNEEQDERVAK